MLMPQRVWNLHWLVSYYKATFMTELNLPEQFRDRTGVRRKKKATLKVDMTPMVDLGFLLIAFFIFTTEISKPAVTNLYMPDDNGSSTKVPGNKSLTILLGNKNQVFYYYGTSGEAFKNNRVYKTSYSEINGIGAVIRKKQSDLYKEQTDKKQLMVIIKASQYSSYKNIVNTLDEMLINGVTRHAIVDLEESEARFLEQHM
jgi:biopolymer transport protein ExbD